MVSFARYKQSLKTYLHSEGFENRKRLCVVGMRTIIQNSTMIHKTSNSEQEQVVRGMLQAAVLARLESEDLYGAKLLLALDDTPFSSRTGTLYPLLNRMQKAGLVESRWEINPIGPPKKYYSISSAGIKKLAEYRLLMKKINSVIGG